MNTATTLVPTYYLLLTFEITKEQEALFNDIYDTEHAPYILQVPGVHSCIRLQDASPNSDGMLIYSTLYQFDQPELPHSEAWKQASNRGRWKDMIRPYLKSIERRQGLVVARYQAE
jgi:hypothetical protein